MAEVVTGEAVVLDVPCARFPSRALALGIDLLIQAAMLSLLLVVIGRATGGVGLDAASATAAALVSGVAVIVGYPVAWETLTAGASPGKLAMGLRVVGDDGSPERFRQALVRGLAAAVEIWGLAGSPALICSLLSARGKRLGDLFAGTFVVQQRLPARQDTAPAVPASPGLGSWAAGLEMSALSDSTAETARRYLTRVSELTPAARAQLGEAIAATVTAQVSPPPPDGTPAASVLHAVLAERRRREQARHTPAAAPAAAGPGLPGAWMEAPWEGQRTPAPGRPQPGDTDGPGAPGGFVPPA